MKKTILMMFVFALFGVSVCAQTTPSAGSSPTAATETKTKRKSFRAKKDKVNKYQETTYHQS